MARFSGTLISHFVEKEAYVSDLSENESQRTFLNYINEISFAVDDTKLFLDTHPWDQNALLFFNECSRKRNEALREYASAYIRLRSILQLPVSLITVSWINEPWPWQEGGC